MIAATTFRRRSGKVYHVNNNGGSNSNTGLAASKAFATIQKAHDVSAPGDTILIHAGNGYAQSAAASSLLNATTSGTASAWITYTNFPGDTPVLTTDSSSDASANNNNCTFWIAANYIAVNGIRFTATNTATGLTSGIGFGFYNYTQLNHHLLVTNCQFDNHGGDGFSAWRADYVTVSNCVVFGCGRNAANGPAGIHPYSFVALDTNPGYHNYFTNNIIYNNVQGTGTVIDGEGILIDDFRNDQNGGSSYTPRTLVAGNLCVNNGSSGIMVFRSSHVDVIHNTCAYNQRNLSNGEIAVQGTSGTDNDCNVYNNITLPSSGKTQLQNGLTGVTCDYNCRFGGSSFGGLSVGTHDVTSDPQFVNPQADMSGSFHLQGTSPCLNVGTATYSMAYDLAGVSRPVGAGYDMGCYEDG